MSHRTLTHVNRRAGRVCSVVMPRRFQTVHREDKLLIVVQPSGNRSDSVSTLSLLTAHQNKPAHDHKAEGELFEEEERVVVDGRESGISG